MSDYSFDLFSKSPELDSIDFSPEGLLINPVSDRAIAHAAFIVGCLVQQDVIKPTSERDELLTRYVDGILIVARCLELLPANGDWPTLPFKR
jgi:hypothetical protein